MGGMLRQPLWHRGWCQLHASAALLLGRSAGNRRDYRVGLVGLGRVARRHAYGYVRAGCTLVAGADPHSGARGKAKRWLRVPNVYADWRDMLASESLDLVSVCAPPPVHSEAVVAAAFAGAKAILCEKPIARDLAEADRAIAACRETGTMLMIGHQRRFAPQHRMAQSLVADGVIGPLRHMIAFCPRDILKAGIHFLDMLILYGGPLARVTASLGDERGNPAPDLATTILSHGTGDCDSWAELEFESGLGATVRVSNCGGRGAKLVLLGEGGVIETWWDGGMRYRRSGDRGWTIPALRLCPYLDDFHAEIEMLIAALETGGPSPVPGEAGRASLEAALAIIRANDEGRSVALPLTAP